MPTDPNSMTFGVLALTGMGLVFVALRNVRSEVKTMVLESDDFRRSVLALISQSPDVVEAKGRVKHLERIAKLPETTAIPRERLDQ